MSKVNVVKELSLALDGGSFEKTGFEILKAEQALGVWTVIVKAYQKENEYINHENEVSLATLVARLTDHYVSEVEWDIIAITKIDMEYGFKLDIALKGEGEESEKEDSSGDEKQVEA